MPLCRSGGLVVPCSGGLPKLALAGDQPFQCVTLLDQFGLY